MKICIYGAGAIGGYLAVGLAGVEDVELSIVARGAHLEAVLGLVVTDDVRHAGLDCWNRQYSDPSRIASAEALPSK